jgi:alpha-beta hydrolase superfamily lysophospholipase
VREVLRRSVRRKRPPGALILLVCFVSGATAQAQTIDSIQIRGKPQSLRLYGERGHPPVIVSSGDGGWIHLAPHVAETLSAAGSFVVGLDVKAYLESFTSRSTTLRPADEPRDYATLAAYAARASSTKPILIGVSEGAGLSVLAATDPPTKSAIAGVIGLGLPDVNELAWRWKDSIIYLTHSVPNEPTFSTEAILGRLPPTPLAVIQSTSDEFVPLAEARRVFARAKEPKRLWIVKASDHGFSDNLADFDRRLLEAIAWVRDAAGR